jgi:1-acyl-sn-glycerol-3-phosphate acyltransferase
MSEPWLYRFTRSLLRPLIRLYFSRVEVTGARHLPREGPVILAANHPQSITDALVLGFASHRTLHFIAHSGLFRSPFKRWFLNSCGVIPVYRRDESDASAERNLKAFAAVYDAIEAGQVVCIFPEGTSGQERRVQKLKTGAARMALGSEARAGWGVGVVMVPVGISFESRGRFRSRVLVSYGDRIHASDYRDEYNSDPAQAVGLLTDALGAGIRSRVVDVTHAEYERFVRRIEQVYKGELLEREDERVARSRRYERDMDVAREIPRALEYFLEHRPELIASIHAMMDAYVEKLDHFRLEDDLLRGESPSVRGAAIRFAVLGVLGLPFALWGFVWNGLPYKFTGVLAKRAAPDLTKLHFYQLTWGFLLYVLYYPPLMYLAWRELGGAGAAIFAGGLVVTGVFARWYGRLMRRRRDTLRMAWLQVFHGWEMARLRVARKHLVAELDGAMREFLVVRAGGVVGGKAGPEE